MILIDKLLYMQLFDFNFYKGSVWIVGAGPGDPGLLSLLAYKSIKKAIRSRSVCTFKLDTGLQISGIPTEVFGERKEEFYKFTGPVQLSYDNKQLEGHGGDYHSDGFSSPLCNLHIINKLEITPINEKINIDLLKFSSIF